ncbi:MAG: acetate--CoA ligase family protein [Myxococcales bacterium]|nr:acetate--CoA ligase family protein [Myxococcales bacterium]
MHQTEQRINPLTTIMNPQSVVVAGASNSIVKMGAIQALSLLNSGFAGPVYLLHPTEKQVLGRPTYPSPEALPEAPEVALLVTPSRITLPLLDALGERGVRYAVIVTAGFAEVGADGEALQKELLEITRRHGIRFVGPNCIGILNTHAKMNMTVAPYLDQPGHLGLISQSGTYVAQTMAYLRERGIRYSQAISVGNSLDIDVVDGLDHLGADPHTKAIALYLEGINRGREFVETARRVAREKPIVALYAGGSEAGRRSVRSHTASLGGPDALFDGIFAQAGVLRARSVQEMFDWGHALANMPPPRGRRMAILTHSGGPAASMADACDKAGLTVTEFSAELQEKLRPHVVATASVKNPVDLTFIIESESFVKHLPEILFGAEEIDGILVHGMMDTGFAKMIIDNMGSLAGGAPPEFLKMLEFDLDRLLVLPAQTGKPLVASTFLRVDHAAETFREHGVPLFSSPERAVAAMAALADSAQIRARRRADRAATETPAVTERASVAPRNEYEAKRLLAEYGVPLPREELAAEVADAVRIADRLGYPVAVKGLPPGVAHKTEAGLVWLDLRSAAEVQNAAEKIREQFPAAPLLVSEMLCGGRELVVGLTRFPGFGPCVMLGAGGIFTEAIRDVTFRVAPFDRAEAVAMLDDLKLRHVYGALRGRPAVDREILADILLGVGRLALEHPEIAEIDINPLIVVDGRPIAVDALIVAG